MVLPGSGCAPAVDGATVHTVSPDADTVHWVDGVRVVDRLGPVLVLGFDEPHWVERSVLDVALAGFLVRAGCVEVLASFHQKVDFGMVVIIMTFLRRVEQF